MAGVAAKLSLNGAGLIEDARLAYLSVGGAPALAPSAATALIGEKPTAAVVEDAARAAAAEIDPMEDMHASAAYRRRLVEVLTREALAVSAERARGSR